MKTVRVISLAAVLFCAVVALASAAGISIEAGAVGYLFNPTGANQKASPPQPVTSNLGISPDLYVNGSYTMAIDDATKLKFGALGDFVMDSIPATSSIPLVGRIEPYADLSWGALSARVSFPLYMLGYDNTNDPSQAALKYIMDSYWKGINLGTYYNKNDGATFLFTNYENMAYKFTFDKTMSLTVSASTEISFVPAFWIDDVKPQVSFVWNMLQVDLKESFYFSDQGKNPSTGDAAYNLRVYTEPKITYNFADLGVKGLKAYLAASLYTYDNYPNLSIDAWIGNTNGTKSGSTTAYAVGSSITPGVSYSFGPFYAEAAFKFRNFDASVSNAAGKDPAFEPMIKFSYTLSL
jgi:hypothetical protein